MKKNLFKTLALGSGLLLLGFTQANAQTTQTFTYTGSMQSFTVPSCVAQVTITVNGAKGGDGATAPTASQSNGALGGNGGLGSSAMGVYPVTNGQVLNIYVGGSASGATGGFNGGGNGDSGSGGGGGASDVRSNGTTLTDRIIVAGGGGGGGNGGCASFTLTGGNGGNGGSNGATGLNSQGGGAGQGGNGSTGGAAGIGCSFALGSPGGDAALGTGGQGGVHGLNACQASVSGGAGGGGYYGGGGGGAGSAGTTSCTLNDQGSGGGGAGGSNYFDPAFTSTVITNGIVNGDGNVVITYSVGAPPSNLTATSATITAGMPVTLTANGATSYSWSTTANTQTVSVSPTSTTVYTVTGYDIAGCSSVTTSTVTVNGAALNFSGNNYVSLDTVLNTTLQNSNAITVEAWVNPTDANYLGVIAGNYSNGNSSDMQFLLRRDGNNYNFWVDCGNGFQTVQSNTQVNVGVWQHVAGVWDGNSLKIYINGVLDNTVNGVVGTGLVPITNEIWLGTDDAGTPEPFTGSIDEVRIWKRAVCAEEIQNNMNGEIATTAPGLLANYHFNQGFDNEDNTAISTLTDAAGGNNGTLINFARTGAISNFVGLGGVTTGSTVPAFSNTLSAVATATDVVGCFGYATGIANMAVTGIESPFTYTWSSGGSSATENNLAAGTYTCTVGNACGTITQTVTIAQPTQLMITATAGTINCNGGSTTLTVSATGGTPAYLGDAGTYTVTANSYTYTVSDASNCLATTIITLTQPNAIATTQSPTICAGASLVVGTNTYTTAGTYTDVLTAANGCDSTVTTNLAFYNAIDVSVTVNSTTITASNATATSYQWMDCNPPNPLIPGATQQSYVATVNGNYEVVITEGSCTATSTCTTISNIGIAQYNATNNLQVYPNPFTNELTITSAAKTKALLFDMLGNQIHSFVLQNTTQTISLSELAPGMYYLQVDNSKIKIIKQ